MYNLPYFKEDNPEVVMDFISKHPFAFLTGSDKNFKPVATQVPVFLDRQNGKLFLSGHIMKSTDHHKAFVENPQVLAVFSSPHTYVSASWYTDKKQGSTWNYISVHARGNIRFLGEAELINVLRRTTTHYENNPHSGANFDDLSSEYVQKMSKAIVAFEIEVTSIENVFKLSQNRDKESYNNIIQQLESQDSNGRFIAEEMRKRTDTVFPNEKSEVKS